MEANTKKTRFKTLYSKMLATYLSVTLSLLILLGVTIISAFTKQYISEREAELKREGAEIHTIVAEKYLVDEKRAVALEELLTIARKYDGLIQLSFENNTYGKVSVSNSEAVEKWSSVSDFFAEVSSEQKKSLSKSNEGIIVSNAYTEVSKLKTMTLILNLESGEKEKEQGTIYFTVDMSETNRSIMNLVADIIIFSALGIVLAIIGVLYITERMTRPIIHMTKIVRQFAKGSYDARVEYDGEDEVAELGLTFNRMADEVNTLEAARQSFVANVSHELRSPLTSMRGFLVAMQDGTIPQSEYQKYLQIVIDESVRLSSMVNDLLDMARIESGEHVLNYSVFDITEAIRTTAITFEARTIEKQLEVIIALGEEQVFVEADKQQITHVISNLIDNAIKFSPIGGKLELSILEQRHSVWVCVKDSGQGIPQEDLPHVFDRFYKVEKAHTPGADSGTGLGLSIAQRIIDAHGQTITVKSDNGACFMFSLKRISKGRGHARIKN